MYKWVQFWGEDLSNRKGKRFIDSKNNLQKLTGPVRSEFQRDHAKGWSGISQNPTGVSSGQKSELFQLQSSAFEGLYEPQFSAHRGGFDSIRIHVLSLPQKKKPLYGWDIFLISHLYQGWLIFGRRDYHGCELLLKLCYWDNLEVGRKLLHSFSLFTISWCSLLLS